MVARLQGLMSNPSLRLTNIGLWLVVVILCAPVFVSCNGTGGEGERVSGTVTVDGAPVKNGSIAFKSVDDKTPAGANIRDGSDEAIVPRGKVKVEIRVPVVVGQRKLYDTPDSPTMDVSKESLPANYNDKTELELDVVAGGNNKDWELVSKKKRK